MVLTLSQHRWPHLYIIFFYHPINNFTVNSTTKQSFAKFSHTHIHMVGQSIVCRTLLKSCRCLFLRESRKDIYSRMSSVCRFSIIQFEVVLCSRTHTQSRLPWNRWYKIISMDFFYLAAYTTIKYQFKFSFSTKPKVYVRKSLIVLNWINSVIMDFLKYNRIHETDEYPWNITNTSHISTHTECQNVMQWWHDVNKIHTKKGSKLFRKELTSNEHRLTGFNANQNTKPNSKEQSAEWMCLKVLRFEINTKTFRFKRFELYKMEILEFCSSYLTDVCCVITQIQAILQEKTVIMGDGSQTQKHLKWKSKPLTPVARILFSKMSEFFL